MMKAKFELTADTISGTPASFPLEEMYRTEIEILIETCVRDCFYDEDVTEEVWQGYQAMFDNIDEDEMIEITQKAFEDVDIEYGRIIGMKDGEMTVEAECNVTLDEFIERIEKIVNEKGIFTMDFKDIMDYYDYDYAIADDGYVLIDNAGKDEELEERRFPDAITMLKTLAYEIRPECIRADRYLSLEENVKKYTESVAGDVKADVCYLIKHTENIRNVPKMEIAGAGKSKTESKALPPV